MPHFFKKEQKLKIIPLGGIGTVTKNMYIYEYGADILIVDCGIGFPEEEQLGVDLVIPDISYLRDKLSRIRGIVITHGHDDHYGGLPYLIDDLGKPQIFATKLVSGFIQNKLTEVNKWKGQSLKIIEPEKDTLQLGSFFITPFRVNHSVPDACGLSIKTPIGQIIHAPDFKFDWTPVDGKAFEVGKLARLSQEGVLCLLSDSLGVTNRGYTASEKDIQAAFDEQFTKAERRIFVTTISSNVSRMQQAINSSIKFGRRVVLAGRSIEQNVFTAKRLGYLHYPLETVVSLEESRKLQPFEVTYLISGCYGQENSALVRLARGERTNLEISEGDFVIFSADPIPGTERAVNRTIDQLIEKGARVIYSEIQGGLHVSGHGCRGDLAMMVGLTQPKYFVPIGGNIRHMHEYKRMVVEMGYDPQTVFEPKNGEWLEFGRDKAKIAGIMELNDVFVDGSLVGDVGPKVLEDRRVLSSEGIVVVILNKDKSGKIAASVGIVSRGFVYMADSTSLIRKAENLVRQEGAGRDIREWSKVKFRIEEKLGNFFYKETARKPLVLPVLVDSAA